MSEAGTSPSGTVPGGPEARYVARHLVVSGEELRRASGWLLVLGILLVVLGTCALFVPVFATLWIVLIYGWVLLFAGVAEVVAAFGSLRWGGVFLHLLMGIIDFVLGIFFLRHWDAGAEVITLLLAVGFLVGGAFRLVGAFSMRFPNWGWTALSGFITLLVGVLLWAWWPWNSLTIPGLFLGIQMLFYGWSAVMLALAARRHPW
jgi:uncharacterized membrane protein HdeD (DUF308 family)